MPQKKAETEPNRYTKCPTIYALWGQFVAPAFDKSPAKGRARANLLLLGSAAKDIVQIFAPLKLSKLDQTRLALLQSRLD